MKKATTYTNTTQQSVHDRRYAVFRHRAVRISKQAKVSCSRKSLPGRLNLIKHYKKYLTINKEVKMTQFRKWLKAAPALAMAAVISGAVYGFTLSTAPKKVLTTDWYFTGDNTNEIMTASAWTSIDPENQDCDLVTEALPCKFTSNTALADSVELIQYFQDEYAGDESQVVADAESWRPEP